MQKEIKQTWYFKQSPPEVWEYLTKPELLEQWFTKTDLQPVEGRKFQLIDKNGKIVYCEVLEVTPFTKLAYSWQHPSARGNQLLDSKVEWTLIPIEYGTELHLVHSGFTVLEDRIAHNNGWTRLGASFIDLLNTIRNQMK